MSDIKVAAIQMSCGGSVDENIEKADFLVRKAAGEGAGIILLPELFERPYFCQERRYEYYSYAVPVLENAAVKHFSSLCASLKTVMPISFYEKDGTRLFNSVAMIDADGTLLGVYRKTHIPDDHYYQEKFYFTPGNTGFKVWDTRYGRVGVGICWDQWFPETARSLALLGADIILYPTAIGSEPILDVDSSAHWQRTMQGHSAANIIPVAAANRYGKECVLPCPENGNQRSELDFYGSSFMTDHTGKIIAEAPRSEDAVLFSEYDFDEISEARLSWGLFRDRRPEMYGEICDKK
ncbi:MAG: N-carbamoylputrescine amidase [Eubacteriales bacterium]